MRFKILITFLLLTTFSFAEKGYHLPWGKDKELNDQYSDFYNPKPRKDLLSNIAEKIILFHQNILSPADGPRSNFRPTSARYMLLSIRRYGFFKGYIMGCDRLLRENKDDWVYRTKIIDGIRYKWDPTVKREPLNYSPLMINEKIL